MRKALLRILRCPPCRDVGAELIPTECAEGTVGGHTEIREAVLRCERCDTAYDVRGGIAEMLRDADPVVVNEMNGIDALHPGGDPRRRALERMLRTPNVDDPQHPAHWISVRAHLAQLMAWVTERTNHEPSTGWVLDLGAGSGYSTAAMAELRLRAVSLDISLNAVAGLGAAEHRFRAGQPFYDRVQADMARLPFADGSFRMVTILGAFHHAPDLARTAAEARRVLTPGGELLIGGEPVRGRIKNRDHGAHEREEHGWNEGVYARADYLRALDAAGFDVEVAFPESIDARLRSGQLGRGPANRLLGAAATPAWRSRIIRRLIRRSAFPLLQDVFGLPFVVRARGVREPRAAAAAPARASTSRTPGPSRQRPVGAAHRLADDRKRAGLGVRSIINLPLKVFGLQRSGTNVMRRLLLDNFRITSVEDGTEWKHGPVAHPHRRHRLRRVRFVVCVRDPFAWLDACYRYFEWSRTEDDTVCPHFRDSTTFEQFVMQPHYTWPSPVQRWNDIYRHYLSVLPDDLSSVVRSEDVMGIEGQREQLARVGRELGLERRWGDVRLAPERITTASDRSVHSMDFTYYTEQRYMERFDTKMIRHVLANVDAELAGRLGYDMSERAGLVEGSAAREACLDPELPAPGTS